jgi:hypothetical protein
VRGRSANKRGLWAECAQLRAECLPRAECRAVPSAASRGEGAECPRAGSAGGVPAAAGGVPSRAECRAAPSAAPREARSARKRGLGAEYRLAVAEC